MRNLFIFIGLLLFTPFSLSSNTATEEGVMINGVRWATRNVDAPRTFTTNPEDTGQFYRWGERRGWTPASASSNWNYSLPTATTWTRANDPCPQGWRIPNEDEMRVLREAPYERVSRNGVSGILVGTAPHQIFMPATGWLLEYDGRHVGFGANGYYWSDLRTGTGFARYFGFNRNSLSLSRTNRGYGFTIRCVRDEQSNPYAIQR